MLGYLSSNVLFRGIPLKHVFMILLG